MRAVAATGRSKPATVGGQDSADLRKLARQAGEADRLLKLLGNENRLLVLWFLAARGKMTVGKLARVVKLSQSALSQHLARLRADGLGRVPACRAKAAPSRRRLSRPADAAPAQADVLRRPEVND